MSALACTDLPAGKQPSSQCSWHLLEACPLRRGQGKIRRILGSDYLPETRVWQQFTNRTRQTLTRNRWHSLSRLSAASDQQLLACRNLGSVTLNDIRTVLKRTTP